LSVQEGYDANLAKWSDVQDHLPLLRKLARGNVMEIGVRSGVSTSALLAGIEDNGGKLYSVDINPCQAFSHPDWIFIQTDSITGAEELKKMIPAELELLFVDGDHSYEGCLSDLNNFGPRAKTILVHDTISDFPGVIQAVKEFAASSGRPVTYHEGSYGMAEIR
jgi:predicted O-methyltransferase YrrM